MKLYLSGPMTGIPDYNYSEFARVADLLRKDGHDVISPHELNLRGHSWKECMRIAIVAMLTGADAIVLLAGWEKSRGSKLECQIMEMLELPIYLWLDDKLEQVS